MAQWATGQSCHTPTAFITWKWTQYALYTRVITIGCTDILEQNPVNHGPTHNPSGSCKPPQLAGQSQGCSSSKVQLGERCHNFQGNPATHCHMGTAPPGPVPLLHHIAQAGCSFDFFTIWSHNPRRHRTLPTPQKWPHGSCKTDLCPQWDMIFESLSNKK